MTIPPGNPGEPGSPPERPTEDDLDRRGDPTIADPGRAPRRPQHVRPAGPDATTFDPGRNRPDRARERDATQLDPGRQRRDENPQDWGPSGLPPALAERYAVVSDLPSGDGNEATLYLVHEHGDDRSRLLKLYDPGREPDPAIRAWLVDRSQAGRSGPIVTLFDAGQAAGRAYEVMEYLAGGNLYNLTEHSSLRVDGKRLTGVVKQVAMALAETHAAGLLHSDVKPANVLIRSRTPLDVALTDFGISTVIGSGGERYDASLEMTMRYAAPELLVAHTRSAAADWWALGMTAAELASGCHPFATWDEHTIRANFASARPVDLPADIDDRLRLLCRGLLTQDAEDRWGADQVLRWADGHTPELADHGQGEVPPPSGSDSPPRAPFRYDGMDYFDPDFLATTLAEDWEVAAGRFFPASRKADRRPWRELRDWLATLDDPEHSDPGRSRLIQLLERRGGSPDVKLLRLVRWLHPKLPPFYRHESVTPARLAVLAQHAAGDPAGTPEVAAGNARDIVADLWAHSLLPSLANAPGGTGLTEIHQRWTHLHERWQAFKSLHASRHSEDGPPLRDIPDATVRAYLLWLAAAEQSARTWLRANATRLRAELPAAVPWFAVLTAVDADVTSLLAAALVSGEAREAALQAAEAEQVSRARRRQMLQSEAIVAWRRRHDRPVALAWAAAGTAIVAIFWSWAIGLSDVLPFASVAAVTTAWACAVLSIVVLAGAELWIAGLIGGPYYPRYSLIGVLVRGGGRQLRGLQDRGLVVLSLADVAVLGLIAAMSYLPFLLPLACTAGHAVWTRARYRRWQADEAARQEELRQAARERRAEQLGRVG